MTPIYLLVIFSNIMAIGAVIISIINLIKTNKDGKDSTNRHIMNPMEILSKMLLPSEHPLKNGMKKHKFTKKFIHKDEDKLYDIKKVNKYINSSYDENSDGKQNAREITEGIISKALEEGHINSDDQNSREILRIYHLAKEIGTSENDKSDDEE